MSETEKIMKPISEKFLELKRLIDNHPNTFSVFYDEKLGYILSIDLDSLKPPLEK